MLKKELLRLLSQIGSDDEPVYMDVSFSKPRISFHCPVRALDHDPEIGLFLSFNEEGSDNAIEGEGQIIADATEIQEEEVPRAGTGTGY